MATTPISTPINVETAWLYEGQRVSIQGNNYIILRTMPKNYLLKRESDGATLKYPRFARGITLLDDGKPVAVEETLPQFTLGDPVRVSYPTGKFHDKVGLVCKVNPTTYHVVIRNEGVISVSFSLVVADK